MNRSLNLAHSFVDLIPDELDQGTLYISIKFATAAHVCCCGCGQSVFTPLSPTDWKLIFDGVSASLSPSIGNWSFPCRSHYWIRSDRVHWAETWSDIEVARCRDSDRRNKEDYLNIKVAKVNAEKAESSNGKTSEPEELGFWGRVGRLFRS